jgi:hypothetical protein
MSFTVLQDTVTILEDTIESLSVSVTNSSGTLVDPYRLILTVTDTGGASTILTDTWPTLAARIVKDVVGQFHVDFGNVVPNVETNAVGEFLFDWSIQLALGGVITHTIQKAKVLSTRVISFLPEFGLLINKALKLVDHSNECFLGYTDSQLVSFLEGGLGEINAYQPSGTFSMDTYPDAFRQILYDAGLITGVISQQLFAIDTDIPNYNDQGTSFVISHQPQLASFLNQISARLDRLIPQMKLQMISSGMIHCQAGPNFRLQCLLSASPTGSLFRNCYFSG